jgi:hypothetical protein
MKLYFKSTMLKALNAFIIFIFFWSNVLGQSHIEKDVVIYGATASGVTAAIAAAREGVSVLLIEPGKNIGGMVTGGLSHTDYGDRTVIGGLTLEFFQKIADNYDTHVFYWRGAEPHVGERILKDWLKEYGVEVIYEKRVISVEKENNRISMITLSDDSQVLGSVFIDAGYEGDLMAKAGISYVVGREGIKDYNESWAGRQPITFTSHQIDARISPLMDEKERKLLPLVHQRPMVGIGEGDDGVQSYCFRLIATDEPGNMIPWPKPDNYEPKNYELVRRYYREKPSAGPLIGFSPTLPNRKADINSGPGISTNLLDGSSWLYPDADYNKRDSIWQWHKDYTLGLAWFLSHDPEVPAHVRESMKKFGLCKDEYVENDHFPHQLYVRVARRMQGEYFMTQHDLMSDTVKYDAIGMGSYNIDVREMQRSYLEISRFPDMKLETYNEGYLSIPVAQYEIPYRSMVPKFEECENLLVPVCISASAIAIASIRMEPQYMIMGESAGVGAAMAVKSNRPVQKIDVYSLQEKLLSYNHILSLKGNPYGKWNTENEIVIDNQMKGFASFTGNWFVQEKVNPERFEMNFRHKPKGQVGDFQFHPYLFKSGLYKVSIWYPSSKEYDKEVPVIIHHQNGESKLKVDQRSNGGKWIDLGEFNFKEGTNLALTILGESSKYVVADAVKFEWVK